MPFHLPLSVSFKLLAQSFQIGSVELSFGVGALLFVASSSSVTSTRVSSLPAVVEASAASCQVKSLASLLGSWSVSLADTVFVTLSDSRRLFGASLDSERLAATFDTLDDVATVASKLDLHHSVVKLCAVVGSDAVSCARWGRVDESGRAEVLTVDVFVEVSRDKRTALGEECLQ